MDKLELTFKDDDEWTPTHVGINWETEIYCTHCDEQIESAYEVVN